MSTDLEHAIPWQCMFDLYRSWMSWSYGTNSKSDHSTDG